jgi:two-component system, sensor histidine kinase and response regulator
MSIDATERAELDHLRLATHMCGLFTWRFELGTDARATFTGVKEALGYEPAEVPDDLDAALDLLVVPGDRARVLAELHAYVSGVHPHFESEHRVRHKDGSVHWALARGAAVRDRAGNPIAVTGSSVDVTRLKVVEDERKDAEQTASGALEQVRPTQPHLRTNTDPLRRAVIGSDRRSAEEALRESEERFRRTFDNAAVGMIVTDLEGTFLESNARFCEFLGYSPDELVGRRLADFMVPGEVSADLERQRAVACGHTLSFTRDARYLRKDGEAVWGNTTSFIVQRHADGRPAHVMGILQDITDRKALEAELERAQTRMLLAIRGSDVAVFEGELPGGSFADSTWTHFNMWEPMGYDPATVPTDASHVSLNVHPDDLPPALAQFEAAIQSKATDFYLEHRYVLSDGSIRWRLTRGTFVFDDTGTLQTFIGTATDITRLKHIEAELQRANSAAQSANRAKDEFLANVSHEIRTPMNAILGMTELALDSAPSEHQRQLLSTVRSAAKNLLTIINDLLDFSKIASGKLTLEHVDFSLRAAVGDTLRALAVRAHRKGLELLCHVRAGVPDALEGDVGRLRQVLMNLVSNAIKFTPQGEVEVDVETEVASDASVMLVFTVRDTGIGIARDKQAAIFDAFEQEDSSTTRKYGGTGLGLTISAQLAQLMNGDITVESAPGCGSTFRFTARFARSTRGAGTTLSSERLANLKVLVVDDHETNRRILVEWLTSWRMQPASASNATEALAALTTASSAGASFSVVLLDARMPEIDGVTLASQIRRRWEARAPRLILLSSDDDAELVALARQNGALAFLLKPVQQSELLEAIWAVMNLDDTVPASAGLPAGPQEGAPLRVLVAEDNDLNVALLQELLRKRGHAAEFARDGRAALVLALRGEFDLMLLDLHMPGLDGFEVVRAIRDHERGTNEHLRVVALTARSSMHDRQRCLDAGMDAFLAKPIEAAALWATMGRLTADSPPVATSPRAVQAPLLDPRAIFLACGGDAGILEKLALVFRQKLPVLVLRVRAALARGDLSDLSEAAHQLVGTVGAFSTLAADAASRLEDAAMQEDRERCAALVEELGSQCDALLEATATLSIDSSSR